MSVFAPPERLLRKPAQFAALLLADGPSDDLDDQISSLIGWSVGVYLQYFKRVHDVEVASFSFGAASRVRPVVDELEQAEDRREDLLLAAHFLTFVEHFDEDADRSGGLDEAERRFVILQMVAELVDRLGAWAAGPAGDGEMLRATAKEVTRDLRRASRRI